MRLKTKEKEMTKLIMISIVRTMVRRGEGGEIERERDKNNKRKREEKEKKMKERGEEGEEARTARGRPSRGEERGKQETRSYSQEQVWE